MSRHHSHLSQVEIRDIVQSYYQGEKKNAIASRLDIDHSTVIYHIRKYEKTIIESQSVYGLIKAGFRKVCLHPSLKCLLCGTAEDHLHSHDALVIRDLTQKLERAHKTLREHGLTVE